METPRDYIVILQEVYEKLKKTTLVVDGIVNDTTMKEFADLLNNIRPTNNNEKTLYALFRNLHKNHPEAYRYVVHGSDYLNVFTNSEYMIRHFHIPREIHISYNGTNYEVVKSTGEPKSPVSKYPVKLNPRFAFDKPESPESKGSRYQEHSSKYANKFKPDSEYGSPNKNRPKKIDPEQQKNIQDMKELRAKIKILENRNAESENNAEKDSLKSDDEPKTSNILDRWD